MIAEKTPRLKCAKRIKTCRNPECAFKFLAGDQSWKCSQCGEDRHCRRDAVVGETVCSLHGAGGGRPPVHARTTVPSQIASAFNRIYDSPDILSLAYSQALIESRIDQIMQRVEQHDASGSHQEIIEGIKKLERAIKTDPTKMNMLDVQEAMFQIKRAIDPLWVELNLWNQAITLFESARRHNDTERKYLAMYDQLIPADQVVEALVIVIGKALRYITVGSDRSAYAKDMRLMLPRIND